MIRSNDQSEGPPSGQPLSEVAPRALRKPLKAVQYYAPLAAKNWDEDNEFVHQLRVATRRAHMALRIFADVLPKAEARWMKKTLRGLRQAAGTARDLDVLGERLLGSDRKKRGRHSRALVQQISDRRRKAQKPLATTYKKTKRKGLRRRSRALTKSVRWRRAQPEPTFAEAARATLLPLVDAFFAAAEADLTDIEAIHQLRISGKRVRYALQLLGRAFDESIHGRLYASFEEIQGKLGRINDHATAMVMFDEWIERAEGDAIQSELAGLFAGEKKKLDAKCQEFGVWWTAERAAELKEHFVKVLRPLASATTEGATLPEPTSEETPDNQTIAAARHKSIADA